MSSADPIPTEYSLAVIAVQSVMGLLGIFAMFGAPWRSWTGKERIARSGSYILLSTLGPLVISALLYYQNLNETTQPWDPAATPVQTSFWWFLVGPFSTGLVLGAALSYANRSFNLRTNKDMTIADKLEYALNGSVAKQDHASLNHLGVLTVVLWIYFAVLVAVQQWWVNMLQFTYGCGIVILVVWLGLTISVIWSSAKYFSFLKSIRNNASKDNLQYNVRDVRHVMNTQKFVIAVIILSWIVTGLFIAGWAISPIVSTNSPTYTLGAAYITSACALFVAQLLPIFGIVLVDYYWPSKKIKATKQT